MPVPLPQDRIIVALDVDSSQQALALVRELKSQISWFKIGLELFSASGPEVVRQVLQERVRVFLDLKLHDIPNTVTRAALQIARLGVDMMTLHTLGGERMMREVRDNLRQSAKEEGIPVPVLLGVTVLTSIDQDTLTSLGIGSKVDSQVSRLAGLAERSGLDGIVASPLEVGLIRSQYPPPFLVVTPGIRAERESRDDQARTMTASEAVEAGADFIVVGRSITRAEDPLASARKLVEDIRPRTDPK